MLSPKGAGVLGEPRRWEGVPPANPDVLEKQLQQSHVDRLTKNECTPAAGMIFSDICSGLERVADHATNIAFAILDE